MMIALLMSCLLLALLCVISRGYLDRRLEEEREKLNEAQREAQRTATMRLQNEGLLSHEETRERQLRATHQGLTNAVMKIQEDLAKRGGEAPPC